MINLGRIDIDCRVKTTFHIIPFNIIELIRNAILNNIIYQRFKTKNTQPSRSKNTRFNNSCVF